jgi:DNA-directed RNA polymerase specialized sigma24 family protein
MSGGPIGIRQSSATRADGRLVRYPSLCYLETMDGATRSEIVRYLLGRSIPVEDCEDALHETWLRADAQARRHGIDTQAHPLAHPQPTAWMKVSARNHYYAGRRDDRWRRANSVGEADEIPDDGYRSVPDRIEEEGRRVKYERARELIDQFLAGGGRPLYGRFLLLLIEDLDSLLARLDEGWRAVLDLYRTERVADLGIRLTNDQIGEHLYSNGRAAGNGADGSPPPLRAWGLRARRRHIAARQLLDARLLAALPPPGPVASLAVLAWMWIDGLDDPEQRDALALRIFGRLAREVRQAPARRDELLEGCRLAVSDAPTITDEVRRISIAAILHAGRGRTPIALKDWADRRLDRLERRAKAACWGFMLRCGMGPEDWADLLPW